MTDRNVANVRLQIKRKKEPYPYFATTEQATQVLTDYDTFPYPRYFRGIPSSSRPIIAEREAGWRIRNDLDVQELPREDNYPNHCFEIACNTTMPCQKSLPKKQSCIIYYR